MLVWWPSLRFVMLRYFGLLAGRLVLEKRRDSVTTTESLHLTSRGRSLTDGYGRRFVAEIQAVLAAAGPTRCHSTDGNQGQDCFHDALRTDVVLAGGWDVAIGEAAWSPGFPVPGEATVASPEHQRAIVGIRLADGNGLGTVHIHRGRHALLPTRQETQNTHGTGILKLRRLIRNSFAPEYQVTA